MSISPIGVPNSVIPSIGAAPAPAAGAAPFGSLVDRFVGNAIESRQGADDGVRDLVTGRTENMHGVLMQVAQADLNFRLVLEIRNRLIESYQEIMKMQV